MSTAAPANAYAGVRVLVLGAGGFIGRWVARQLLDAGATVFAGARDPASAASLLGDGVSIEALDVTDEASVRAAYARARPSVTFNLAGYGVDPGERDETAARRVNVDAIGRIAAAQRATRDPHWPFAELVHVGSALEYGTAAGDLHERTVPLPTTLYGRTKLEGTQEAARAARQSGLRAVTARLFTIYGPGEHPERLLPTLLRARLAAGPIPLTAGTQRRDFGFVEEIAEGLLRLGLSPIVPGEAVNLATGVLHSVRDFVERAARVLTIDAARLTFGAVPTRAEEMRHDPVSVGRLEELTAWRPRCSIEEGVRRTMASLSATSARE